MVLIAIYRAIKPECQTQYLSEERVYGIKPHIRTYAHTIIVPGS